MASYLDLLEEHEMHKNIYVAKANKKTMIAQQLIMDKVAANSIYGSNIIPATLITFQL